MSCKLYSVPQEVKSQSGYTVTVDGKPLDLCDARVLFPPFQFVKRAPFGIFDIDDKINIKITTPTEIHQVDIRPKSKNIIAEFDAHTIQFALTEPTKISIELNGSIENALALFANAPETELPNEKDDVLYFAPGVHDLGEYEIPSGKTLYFAGGSYVYGHIFTAKGAKNVKILGRGILDGKNALRNHEHRLVDLYFADGVLLDGITIVDAPSWTCRVLGCDNVIVRNANIFGCRGNTDGVDVCGSRNVEVYNMFIRNWDDALAVKAFETGDAVNNYFHDCIVWNDFARPIEVGYEHRADEVTNIHYKNIDIIHSLSGYPIIGIHQGDRAHIHDVIFEDIRAEDTRGSQFIDLRIKPSGWNKDGHPGHIDNVLFRNIYLNGKDGLEKLPERSRIEGYDEKSTIEDVVFDRIYIGGKRITSAEECGLNLLQYSKNIRFVQPEEELSAEEKIIPVQSKLEILSKQPGEHGIYKITAKLSLENLSAEQCAEGNIWVEAFPKTDASLDATWEYCLQPKEKKEKEISFSLRAGKYFISIQSQNINVTQDWMLLSLETAVPKLTEEEFRKQADTMAQSFYTLQGATAGKLAVAHNGEELLISGHIRDRGVSEHFIPEKNADKTFACLDVPSEQSKCTLLITQSNPPQKGEVMFMIPETGFGETTALQMGENAPALASELRNIAEITHVFKNQPKVDFVEKLQFLPEEENPYIKCVPSEDGYDFFGAIPFAVLGLDRTGNRFMLEFIANTVVPGTDYYDSVSMFHSIRAEFCVEMFGRFILEA